MTKDNENIYFTDATLQPLSYKNGSPLLFYTSALASFRGGRDGRLMVYNRKTKTTKTLAQDFIFTNGCALDATESSVFVIDSTPLRLYRYWIKGFSGFLFTQRPSI